MMDQDTIKLFRLGIFVLSGTFLLIAAIYLIGRNQDLFGNTIRVNTYFNNVNGLQPGGNVRFAGSDAGTVEGVEIINDTAVKVVLVLQARYASFIREDAVAGIGTDGLMGNKLINIINTPGSAAPCVQDGGTIFTHKPIETDEMLRTLDRTNEYVEEIAYNLKNVTDKISNSRGTIWKLLTDTSLADDADMIFANLNKSSQHIAAFSKRLDLTITKVNKGYGLAGMLLTDTVLSVELRRAALHLQEAGAQSAYVTADLQRITKDLDQGKGALGILLRDSAASQDIRTSITSLKKSTESLQQTLDAIQRIPVLKKYLETEKKNSK